jgi:hypothetical protein
MKSKPRVVQTQTAEPEYPSLQEHLASRRKFLTYAGVTVTAGALAAACNRSLGAGQPDASTEPDATPPQPDATPPQPDATPPQPDATIEIGGIEQQPDYFTVRIPVSGEVSAYLVDGGYASFYVIVATYWADSYDELQEHMADAQSVCRVTLEEHTYDALNTAAGITGAESDLRDALDDFCEVQHGQPATLEAVTLHISYLSPVAELGGDSPSPEYP